jgi:hypothetical protein
MAIGSTYNMNGGPFGNINYWAVWMCEKNGEAKILDLAYPPYLIRNKNLGY